jgi:hypothetical protein
MTETPADAEQAAYFREPLDAERRQLLDGILEWRPLIERRADASRLLTVHRAESQVRHLELRARGRRRRIRPTPTEDERDRQADDAHRDLMHRHDEVVP